MICVVGCGYQKQRQLTSNEISHSIMKSCDDRPYYSTAIYFLNSHHFSRIFHRIFRDFYRISFQALLISRFQGCCRFSISDHFFRSSQVISAGIPIFRKRQRRSISVKPYRAKKLASLLKIKNGISYYVSTDNTNLL